MVAEFFLAFLLFLEGLGKEVIAVGAVGEISEYLLPEVKEQLVTHLFSLQLI